MSNSKHYHHLKNKWVKKHQTLKQNLLSKHKDVINSLKHHLVGGVMLASTPFLSVLPPATTAIQAYANQPQQEVPKKLTQNELVELLKKKLPNEVRPLTLEEEKDISQILSENFHVIAVPKLQNIRLNRSYGLIGQEEHLRRYPGDSLYEHFENQLEENLFSNQNVAPGLGAWGYFADSKEKMSEKEKLREKYYIAVPTFLAPGFSEHVGEYGLFFKYRKMLLVNPENGKAIISDIGDAGPAEWTGKHLGGSPEVMQYLERKDGAEKGPVLYFFVDDPSDTILLGPINL